MHLCRDRRKVGKSFPKQQGLEHKEVKHWEKHLCSASYTNLTTDEIREEMDQMRIELGLVLKMSLGAGKVNVVNCLTKPRPGR